MDHDIRKPCPLCGSKNIIKRRVATTCHDCNTKGDNYAWHGERCMVQIPTADWRRLAKLADVAVHAAGEAGTRGSWGDELLTLIEKVRAAND
jgi:hypothetical protein